MAHKGIKNLRELPNVGKAMEKHLLLLGITKPEQLIGKDPYQMYDALCKLTGKRLDPCIIDVFISAVSYMEDGPARKWWHFSNQRKMKLAGK